MMAKAVEGKEGEIGERGKREVEGEFIGREEEGAYVKTLGPSCNCDATYLDANENERRCLKSWRHLKQL